MEASKLEPYLLLAKAAKGRAAAELINRATSDPGLFVFGELLEAAGIKELLQSDSKSHGLLQLFCYGTWSDYRGNCDRLPPLNSQQQYKLKQLTVVSLAGASKRLLYTDLLRQLELEHVRELEDLLISDCFYCGLLTGKLDQKQQCLHVQEAAARDVRPEGLQQMADSLAQWLAASQAVLRRLEASRELVQESAAAAKQHQAEVEARVDAAKKAVRSGEGGLKDLDLPEDAGTLNMMDYEDRSATPHFGSRPKRRR